jgi:GAF domain-containing protein
MGREDDRLHLLYEVTRRLATFTDLDELLRYATGRVRELLAAEGCAVLLVDPARQEFNFGVVSQSEAREATSARLLQIRFPAHLGVAGWVLAHDQAAAVPDAQQDPRFYSGVDQVTNITTRAILCAPLRARSGNLGVIEVINPDRPAAAEDLELVEALASDIAVAHEKAALEKRLRGEVIGLRQVCRIAGLGLLALGTLLALGAVYVQLAMALPVRELPARPGVVDGVVCLLVGALLWAMGRGWLSRGGVVTS